MTVSTNTRKAGPFTGNGVTTTFAFGFKLFAKANLRVVLLNELGVENTLVLDSDYSVTLNGDQDVSPGGTVTYPISGSPLPSTRTLTLVSAVPDLQLTDITNGSGFYPRTVEDALDYRTAITQQNQEKLDRALVLPVSVPAGVSTQLPAPDGNTLIGWNQGGTGLQNFDPGTIASIVAFGTAAADLFSGNGVQTMFGLSANPGVINNLDVSIGGVQQRPVLDYTWTSGTNITFTTAPPVGSNNILVRYQQGLPTQDSALRIDLANPAAGFGSDLIQTKQLGGFAVARTQSAENQDSVKLAQWLGGSMTASMSLQKAFDRLAQLGGGRLIMPNGGDFGISLNLSGYTTPVEWEGNGCTLRPAAANQANQAVIFANNSTGLGTFSKLRINFRSLNFTGRVAGSTTEGDVDDPVRFISAAADFYDTTFQYGRQAAFHGTYAQYCEFYKCLFGACIATASSAACLIDGFGSAESSNEILWMRPKFLSANNGLIIKGGTLCRVYSPLVQDIRAAGTAGIFLTTDSTGFGNDGTAIDRGYFEVNAVPHIVVGVAPNATISECEFLGGAVFSTHCYNTRWLNNTQYNPVVATFNHPAGNGDVASLTFIGNNFEPTLNLDHSGPTRINYEGAAGRTRRNDNMMLTTGQGGTLNVPLIAAELSGFKPAILRNTLTDLFRINQETFATSAVRYLVFELLLTAVDDTADVNQFGFSGRAQRNYLFVSNNAGATAAYISATIDGSDLGVNPAFTAPGSITVTAAVSAGNVTVRAQYAGTGASPASTPRITIGYQIRAMGGNPFWLTKL